MEHFKIHIKILICLAICVGCSKNNPPAPEPQPTLSLSVNELSFSDEGGELNFTVTSNSTWSISGSTGWITLSQTSGSGNATIKVTTTKNETYDEKNQMITISSGTLSKNLTVFQRQKDGMTITKKSYDIVQKGGTISVEIKANLSYTYTIPQEFIEWISVVNTKGLSATTLNFSIKENPGVNNRSGIIAFMAGKLKDTVKVYQVQRDELLLTNDRADVGKESCTLNAELKCNIDYDVIMPADANWITDITTKAYSSYNLKFNISENATDTLRQCYVIFKDKKSSLADTLFVAQYPQQSLVPVNTYYEGIRDGGVIDLEIKAVGNYSVEIPANASAWISEVKTKAPRTDVVQLNLAKNETGSDRSAQITVRDGITSKTFTIEIRQRFENPSERAALLALYNSTNGDRWIDRTNWGTGAPLSDWYGVKTDQNGHVVELYLVQNNLEGYIPPEIGYLTELQYLYLGGNEKLTGDIPHTVWQLTKLKWLFLSFTKIRGLLPSAVKNLVNVEYFLIYGLGGNLNTTLQGEIPVELFNLPNVYQIELGNNSLTGTIPNEIGKNKLRNIFIEHNKLTGQLPSSYGNLEVFYASDNKFSKMPEVMYNFQKIIAFDVSFNKLSGRIDKSIASSPLLNQLDLNDNNLSGTLPKEIGSLTNLLRFRIQNNRLGGTIPQEIKNHVYWSNWNVLKYFYPQQPGFGFHN